MARIGTVGYLNARPLSDRIDIDQYTLVLAYPAEVARMLRDGEVDVALVPVAAVLAEGDAYRIVPRVCIGAEGQVHSVVLVAERPPEEWERVRLDGVSRTSRALARLLLKEGPLAERVRPGLIIEDVEPNQGLSEAGDGVAALVIGDAARTLDPRWSVRLDLAEIWNQWTGLPFVFAVWAGRKDLDPAVVRHLVQAGEAGVGAVPQSYAGDDLRYLTENLRYELDDAALMGLRRFGALGHAAGLFPVEDVELYGPATRQTERPSVFRLLSDVLDGQSLNRKGAQALFEHASLADLAAAAHEVRMNRHPTSTVGYYVGGLDGEVPSDPPGVVSIEVGGRDSVIEQLFAVRAEQTRTGAIRGVRVWAVEEPGSYGSTGNTAFDHQRAVALARLVLDNIDHCFASPATEGLGMAQASIRMGCDHFGLVTLPGEPDTWANQINDVERHIRDAGFEPRRDALPTPVVAAEPAVL